KRGVSLRVVYRVHSRRTILRPAGWRNSCMSIIILASDQRRNPPVMSKAAEPRSTAQSPSPCLQAFDLSVEGREPIRAELFGPESAAAFARELAACTVTAQIWSGRPLTQRFEENGRVLRNAVHGLAEWVRHRQPLTADAEWLLDNWYVLEEVLREVRRDLPHGYYRELPKVTCGPLAGYPRVYTLALALVAHTDSALDEDHLGRFVEAYQTETSLTIV